MNQNISTVVEQPANSRNCTPNTCCRRFWNGCKITFNDKIELAQKISFFVISGALLLYYAPLFAPPFFSFAIGTASSRLVVKAIDVYDISKLDSFKSSVDQTRKNRKWMLLITLVAIVALCLLSQIASAILALLVGIFNGITIGMDTSQTASDVPIDFRTRLQSIITIM